MLNSISKRNLAVPETTSNRLNSNRKCKVILIAEELAGMRSHAAEISRRALQCEVEICEAVSAVECIDLAMKAAPDLIIMDIATPLTNGLETARQIWSQLPSTKILFWSYRYGEMHLRDLLRILPDGALYGCILKSEDSSRLEYAVLSLLEHQSTYLDQQVSNIICRMSRKGEAVTDVEYELLLNLCLGLTDKAIAKHLGLGVRCVQNRINTLGAKLLKSLKEQNTDFKSGSGIFNLRTRLLFEAFKRGLIGQEILEEVDQQVKL